MNFKSLTFLAVLALVVASCGSDDDKPDHPLVGTWVLIHDTRTDCNDSELNQSIETPCTLEECTKIQYKSNGTVIVFDTYDGVTDDESAAYTIDGNTVIGCETVGDCDEIETFTIDGDTLTMVSVEGGSGCTKTLVYTKL